MKTDTLIQVLATHAGAAPQYIVHQRLMTALLFSVTSALLFVFLISNLLPLPLLLAPATFFKVGYSLVLAASAYWLTSQLARPIALIAKAQAVLAVIFVLAIALASAVYFTTEESQRTTALLGQTWLSCPWIIALVSLPGLYFIFRALYKLAPTKLAQAGFSAGLLSGTLGSTAYALNCPEQSLLFVVIWYTSGMLVSALLGLLAHKWLRW